MSEDRNEANDLNSGYKVGYRRPPKEHQFKAGRSGNARGGRRRPPLPDIAALLNHPIRVRVNGKEEKLPPREAAMLRIAVDGAQGKRKPLFEMLSLLLRHGLLAGERDDRRCGVRVVEQDVPWGLVRLILAQHDNGLPRNLDAALRTWWPVYKAGRTAEEAALEDAIGYRFIKEIEE